MINSIHQTYIDIKARLSGRESQLFNELLEENKNINKTPTDLISFIFRTGLEFISASFKGFSLAQNISGMFNKSQLVDTQQVRKILEDAYNDEPIFVKKCLLNNREIEFKTDKNNDLLLRVGKMWHKLRIYTNDKPLKIRKGE